jgi:hypothetical protein
MRRLLRVLPGKRLVGEAEIDGCRVLAKLFVGRRSEKHWRHERTGLAALVAAGVPTPEAARRGAAGRWRPRTADCFPRNRRKPCRSLGAGAAASRRMTAPRWPCWRRQCACWAACTPPA